MIRETSKDQNRPALDAENFQRLLAAAYILQERSDRPPVRPIDAGHLYPFVARAIVQRSTPSLVVREPRIPEFRSGAQSFTFSKRVLGAMNILGKGPAFGRTFEAFAIAMVFCAFAGLSIHRVSPLLDRTSHTTEQQNVSQRVTPAATVLASNEPVLKRGSRRQIVDQADVVAKDTTIRYHKRALDLYPAMRTFTDGSVQAQLLPSENPTSKPAVRSDLLAADTVIRDAADSSSSRIQDKRKAALNPQGYK